MRPLRRGREHVADLGFAVGDDHAVDEQLGQQQTYQAMGRNDEALADYTRAIELDPGYRPPQGEQKSAPG